MGSFPLNHWLSKSLLGLYLLVQQLACLNLSGVFLAMNLSADHVIFMNNGQEHMVREETGPVLMNAFQLIAMSGSLDLSGLFEEEVSSFLCLLFIHQKNCN